MTGKRMAGLMVAALVIVAVSQPVMAGVGGCRGVSCSSQVAAVSTPAPTLLDVVSSLLPPYMGAALKAVAEKKPIDHGVPQQPGDPTTEGVGGCRILGTCTCGVGGC